MITHNWTDNDEIIVLYLYRFPALCNMNNKRLVSGTLGMPLNSVGLKIGNFQCLDTDGASGMPGYSVQAKRIYERYKSYSDDDFTKVAETALRDAGIDKALLTSRYDNVSVETLEAQAARAQAEVERLKKKLEGALNR